MKFQEILEAAAVDCATLDRERLARLLDAQDTEAEQLYHAAYRVKTENVGRIVHFRGIIEFSNICAKNCYYCGIRRGNHEVKRYQMPLDEILDAAQFAMDSRYGSIVLQSGEIQSEKFTQVIEETLLAIREHTDGKLGVTLSLGEQTEETFQRWMAAGAHRYLLRIETSDPELYRVLHPQDGLHDFERRMESLHLLRKLGWQTGSGILIGVPEQSAYSLAGDLLFLRDFDVDMIGMGPFVPHHQTPLYPMENYDPARQLRLGLNMIACARLLMPDINIASTTALQALAQDGRERGLLAGANIIMPNISETKYRDSYQLYDGKPALNENAQSSRDNLEKAILNIGETIGYNAWGDSLHFARRRKKGA